MANLGFSHLIRHAHRVDKFLSNIDTKTPFKLVSGGFKVLEFDRTNPDTIKFEADLRKRGQSAAGPKSRLKPLKDSSGKLYALSDLEKTADFGGAGENRGNVAEGILAAAIGARFISKTKRISPADIEAVIKKLPAGESQLKNVSMDSPNKDPRIVDKVHIFIELAKADMKNLQTKKYPDLLQSAAAYVNGSKVMKWGDLLYNNNIINTINIKSMGISGQINVTKVDTYVEVGDKDGAPKRIDINLSLKAGDVKQFGQEAGMKWEAQQRLWSNFGISLDKQVENQYVKLHSEKKPFEAFKTVFQAAQKKLASSNSQAISKAVGSAIVYYATLGEQDVDLLQLKGNKAVLYRFSDAVKLLEQVELDYKLTFGTSQLPTLTFMRKSDSAPLVRIRVKKSGAGYFRSIVEKESLMSDILAVKYT
jgi:hypothetical protein